MSLSASVVIPAYNEATVIERCLDSVQAANLNVVVVTNGCHDDTAERARRLGVRVIDLVEASKVAALNAGDRASADVFPRVYLDADIRICSDDLTKVVEYLANVVEPRICAPTAKFDLRQSSLLVRLFYSFYTRLPYLNEKMIGSGFYAVNAAGRARWDQFPDLVADDLFVQGCFDLGERTVLDTACFHISAPRNLRSLIRVRTRTYRGNREAAAAGAVGTMTASRNSSLSQARGLVTAQPRLCLAFSLYFGVNGVAALRARFGREGWLTDTSSR